MTVFNGFQAWLPTEPMGFGPRDGDPVRLRAEPSLLALIRSDCYRYQAATSWRAVLRAWRRTSKFRWQVAYRVIVALRNGQGSGERRGWRRVAFPIVNWWFQRMRRAHRVDVPFTVAIGPGLSLGTHDGSIVVEAGVRIGANCKLAHGCTLGRNPRGKRKGSPVLGDRVYVGVGAVVAGGITIGDDVVIAPLSFVNDSIPAHAVVAGNPARVVSMRGGDGYVKRPWEGA